MRKMQMPVTFCAKCGAHGYSLLLANRQCGRMIQGKRCRGMHQSALEQNNWTECAACHATGFEGKRYCRQCDGSGWIFMCSLDMR
jgi:DnaJ-class molecular chaperone